MVKTLGLLAALAAVMLSAPPSRAQTVNGVLVATVTDTPTHTPTGTPAGTATATLTHTPGTPAATLTHTPTGTPAGTASATVTGTPTGTAAATATATITPTRPATATVTPTTPRSPTITSTSTPSPTPLPIHASIILGSATGLQDTTVSFSVVLETDVEVAGTENDISFDAKAPIAAGEDGKPLCTVNPDIHKDGTTFAFQPADCTPGTDCTGVRALVLALDNLTPIASNSLLYTCQVAIAADAAGTVPLTCSNPASGNADGDPVGTDCTDGSIVVAPPGQATIVVGMATGPAGDFVPLEVTLETAVEVARTSNDITFPPQAGVAAKDDGKPMCTVNPEIEKDGTTFAFEPDGCTPGTDCTSVRAVVLSLTAQNPIPTGSVLYTCTVAIATDAADATYPLTCSNASADGPDGAPVGTDCTDGSVVVGVQPTATSTATPTLPVVLPTSTDTPELPTPTLTTGVSTPTQTSGVSTPTSTQGAATPTATIGAPTATFTPGTPVPPTPTGTPLHTATRVHPADSDSCQIVDGSQSHAAWMLLAPAVLLLRLRRRR